MGVWAYPYLVACGLLLVAGMAKALDPTMTVGALDRLGLHCAPAAVRVGGAAEALLAVTAALSGNRLLALLVGTSYAVFSAYVLVALGRHAPIGTCGCFGRADTPPSLVHVILDVAAIVSAAGVALGEGTGLSEVLDGRALAGVPFLASVGAGVVAAYLAMTVLARRLVSGAGPTARGS